MEPIHTERGNGIYTTVTPCERGFAVNAWDTEENEQINDGALIYPADAREKAIACAKRWAHGTGTVSAPA